MSAKFSRLFHKNTTGDHIHIHPRFLHANLDEAITSQIQKKVEGICNVVLVLLVVMILMDMLHLMCYILSIFVILVQMKFILV
jgi:hypothetical protein